MLKAGRENPHGKSLVSLTVTSLGAQQQHGDKRKICSPGKRGNTPLVRFKLDQIIIALCRIFGVIEQKKTS
jgi:hypothetical protein